MRQRYQQVPMAAFKSSKFHFGGINNSHQVKEANRQDMDTYEVQLKINMASSLQVGLEGKSAARNGLKTMQQ